GGATPPERGPRPPRRSPKRQQPASGQDEADTQALVVRSRGMFLRDVERQLARRELYNLDEEFAKTHRNRSPIVVVSVVVFVIVMVAVGIAVTTYIQQRSQHVPVNISSFQDVNLMELLDRAKQLNDQLTAAQQEYSGVKGARDTEVLSAQTRASQQIQLINNEMISQGAKQQRVAAVRNQLAAQTAQIDARYADQLKSAQSKIDNLQSQQAQYDTRQMQQAKRESDILNNQQHLFDLQMQKTVSYYTGQIKDLNTQFDSQIAGIQSHNQQLVDLLNRNHAVELADLIKKYNPTFTSPGVLAILNEAIPKDPAPLSIPAGVVQLAVQSGAVDAASISDLQNRMQSFSILMGRMQQIPYENSIPPALSHLAYLNSQIVAGYQQIGNGLTAVIAQQQTRLSQMDQALARRDATIAEYNQALSSLIRNSRENGYIIDAHNPSNIAVFVDPLYHVQNGDTGYVFRQDDQPIGTIKFIVANGEMSGRLVSLTKQGSSMQPFDKILLNLK
ncbi:MAG TPA: hypothetical protein VMV68_10960, partial [Spirochaetia bacterium]|nr:hypothetical protein [Spirochaetia bacterium]